MQDAVNIVNHAAQQSDRWLFLGILLLLIVAGVAAMRYLVRRNEMQSDRMHTAFEKNTAMQVQLAGIIEKNTHALERSTDVVEEAVDVIGQHKRR